MMMTAHYSMEMGRLARAIQHVAGPERGSIQIVAAERSDESCCHLSFGQGDLDDVEVSMSLEAAARWLDDMGESYSAQDFDDETPEWEAWRAKQLRRLKELHGE